jgi:hypothetical protein
MNIAHSLLIEHVRATKPLGAGMAEGRERSGNDGQSNIFKPEVCGSRVWPHEARWGSCSNTRAKLGKIVLTRILADDTTEGALGRITVQLLLVSVDSLLAVEYKLTAPGHELGKSDTGYESEGKVDRGNTLSSI